MFLNFPPTSLAQEFACPVTKLLPVTFEPVGIFAKPLRPGQSLLGTEKLFTIFPGNWHAVERTDHGYWVNKVVWGSKVVDLRTELESSLTITGRRLDAESAPLVDWDAHTAWLDRALEPSGKLTPVADVDKGQFFITSAFYVPSVGCWEVTGHFHGEDLKVVIDIK